ncbi:hypothetical protein [Rickettsia rickettsii]|uniref:hypothetical protein n=1 Tax=Rickettsia rickettsii TaxID=783 RepID=UPI00024F9B29|nr:hypothetical protein [Rickettsia rickettsii]AFB22569.1 hypothetical protein RPN_05465 [Rickettsia rickettsii str. Brazil]USD87008.1 hypothetical protein NDY48_01330 [Rickettsia rickettsii]USD88322.1 hypothetical protein NDY49_01345 [Rickettsia rickettsii]
MAGPPATTITGAITGVLAALLLLIPLLFSHHLFILRNFTIAYFKKSLVLGIKAFIFALKLFCTASVIFFSVMVLETLDKPAALSAKTFLSNLALVSTAVS